MEYSKLDRHKWNKGKLIAPLNQHPMQLTSWADDRLPEYIWIGLILEKYNRREALIKLNQIIVFLQEIISDKQLSKLSSILSLPHQIQARIFEKIIEFTSEDILSPLTVIFTYDKYPVFSEFFTRSKMSIQERHKKLLDLMNKIMNHQSNESTDIQFVVLWFGILSGKIIFSNTQENLMDNITHYGNTGQEEYGGYVRSMALGLSYRDNLVNKNYLEMFWKKVSVMTECQLFSTSYKKDNIDPAVYMEYIYEIYVYLTECLKALNPIDDKMNVIMGISTYSYKRLKEIVDHNLLHTISGRSGLRVLIENFIMLKYLLKNESAHDNIWKEYQFYGLGSYKLTLLKWRDSNKDDTNSFFDIEYIEMLINEFRVEEFTDIDTNYFNKDSVRDKAILVDEKELHGFYYDCLSSFEHGMWGAIRETSLTKCGNPSHKYHTIPDINCTTTLKSILHDCIMVMNKTVHLLHDIYGIPEHLLKEVRDIEKSFNK